MPACTRSKTLNQVATESEDVSFNLDDDILAEAHSTIERLMKLVEQPPCVVLLGDTNSGKTTVANKLLDGGILPTGVIPNTRHPMLLRHATSISLRGYTTKGKCIAIANETDVKDHSIALLEISMPNPRLMDFEVLDTPAGFGFDMIDDVIEMSSVRIPIWCTSATQAWKESERQAWLGHSTSLRRHGVLALTRLDCIQNEKQRQKLITRLRAEAGPLFSQIMATADPSDNGPYFTKDIAKLARRLQDHRQRTIVWLCERIIKLTKNAELDKASEQADTLVSGLRIS